MLPWTPRHLSAPARARRRARRTALIATALVAIVPLGIDSLSAGTSNTGGDVVAQGHSSAVLADLTDLSSRQDAATPPATSPTPTTSSTLPPKPHNACPAPGAQFINSWGFSRSGGRRHKGVDMMAPHGSPLLAPAAGWIREHHSSLGGISYYLTAVDGTEYFGAHLQSFVGDFVGHDGFVEAGTFIGTVGSSGNASAGAPHLHWEIKTPEGVQVNPYLFALAFCSDPQAAPPAA